MRMFGTRTACFGAMFSLLVISGCSDDEAGASSATGGAGGSAGSGGSAAVGGSGGAAATSGAGGSGAQPTGPCTADALEEPRVASTYYVASAEPGADDDACDGLAPSAERGGRCPFRTLSSPRVRALLSDGRGVRVELRAGTYVVAGWDGLSVHGAGTTEAERTVLTSYRDEAAVLDIGAPDGAGCVDASAMTNPACVRQVVRVSGTYVTVQGLTIQNGLAYDFEVNGGAHHLLRCNTFRYTAEFAQRSDCLKLDGNATDVVVQSNVFTGWRSQAIDMTNVSNVLIEANEFFEPFDADAGATGSKFGARDVIIRDNFIHDLGPDTKAHVFALGGTGSPHPDDFEAYGIHVTANRVLNVPGMLAQVSSCKDCSIEGNEASDLGVGILVSAGATGLAECSASATGCRPTEGLRIAGNRMRRFAGGGAAPPNVFIGFEAGEATGFLAGQNLYCAASSDAHRFGWDATLVTFSEWLTASGTDETSSAAVNSDPRCAF